MFGPAILVVCTEEDLPAVQSILEETRWNEDGRGHPTDSLGVPRRRAGDSGFVSSRLQLRANAILDHPPTFRSSLEVLVMRGIEVGSPYRADVTIHSSRSTLTSLRERHLPRTLSRLGLDWQSRLEDLLRGGWLHGAVDKERIDKWLEQFARLGSHKWVGERLLRLLSFWSGARLLEALDLNPASLARFQHVCVNTETIGKSASVLSNQVRKRLRALSAPVSTVEDLGKVLRENPDGSVLYVEDCLLTGTETCSLFRGLLGETEVGRRAKASPLQDPASLRTREIELRFGVIANLGHVVIEKFIQERALDKVTIGRSGARLTTLTDEGVRAVRADQWLDEKKCLRDPGGHIRPIAFSDVAVWGRPDSQSRARAFCESIGAQLWRSYLDGQGWKWDERRIGECGLGMRGQALVLAFAHSVPKSTLPLFWHGGPVSLGMTKVNWMPLFPDAA